MTTIKLRRDTSTNWTTVNPILAEGEVGIDTNNNYVKIGDGSTAWNSLPYATVPPEVLQLALDDKVDYFEVDSPLTDKWQVGSEAELSTNASVSDSGILSDTDYGEYWALNNTTIENYIANQLSYWKIHFIFKTSTNNEVQPFFGLADGAGDYDVNFIELQVRGGYFTANETTTNVSIPTNTWVEVDIEHIEGASNVSATINIEGTISTVSNVLDNNYTLSSAKGVKWLALGVTPFEFDITWGGFYVQNAPYSAKYCLLTNRHIGADNEAFDGQWEDFYQDIIPTAVSVNGSTDLPYTVTVPNDGHVYEYIINADGNTTSTSGNFFIAMVKSNVISGYIWLCGNRTRTTSTMGAQGSAIVPIKYGTDNLYLHRSTNYGGTVKLQVVARRRLGTNS